MILGSGDDTGQETRASSAKPKWLYRYVRLPEPEGRYETGFRRLFSHNEIYFSHPLRFNDPFDCTCLFQLKGSTEEDWRKFFAIKYPEETAHQISDRIRRILRPDGSTDWRYSGFDRERVDSVMREGLEEMRVLCFSEEWDSILMWAHYGDSHRGVCLQFDCGRIEEKWDCEKVVYRSDYPSFAEFLQTALDGAATSRFLLLNKASQWRYEREWRILAYTGVSQTAPATLQKGALRGVLFGCLTSEEDKARVTSWLEESGRQDLNVYDVSRHSEEYRLTRIRRRKLSN